MESGDDQNESSMAQNDEVVAATNELCAEQIKEEQSAMITLVVNKTDEEQQLELVSSK